MKTIWLLALTSCASALVLSAACGEDEVLVRERIDGGTTKDDAGMLACGVAIPTTYDSPTFATNAAVELALASHLREIEDKMRSAEGPGDAGVSASELMAIYTKDSPSLRAVSTASAQTLVETYFNVFDAALGKTWT